MDSMHYVFVGCFFLFILMIASYSLGHLLCKKRRKNDDIGEGSKAVQAAIFAILGLFIAFSFSKAYSRLDERRQHIIQEVNAIGTAYQRLDLLPLAAQPELRRAFKEYVTIRTNLYYLLKDPEAAAADLSKTVTLQNKIWDETMIASQGSDNLSVRLLLIPALNEMNDIVLTRTATIQTHPPHLIFILLAVIAILCSVITGYNSGYSEKHALNIYNLILAMVVSFTFYIILDIEYPAHGLINIESSNKLFLSLPQS